MTQRVLRNLLDEGVSIRNIVLIFESLARHVPRKLSLDDLTEHVRSDLAPQISLSISGEEKIIRAISLDADLEERLTQSLDTTESGRQVLAIDPDTAMVLLEGLGNQVRRAQSLGMRGILVTSPALRLELRRLTRRNLPLLIVVATTEIGQDYRVRSMGYVGFPQAEKDLELAAS